MRVSLQIEIVDVAYSLCTAVTKMYFPLLNSNPGGWFVYKLSTVIDESEGGRERGAVGCVKPD